MICSQCEQNGGFEGDPPAEAMYLLTITAPPGPAYANPQEHLCISHAKLGAAGIIGYGWAVQVELLDPTKDAELIYV